MAKKGMKRPETTHTQPRNDAPPVPEIQGKAKRTKGKGEAGHRTVRPLRFFPFHTKKLGERNV